MFRGVVSQHGCPRRYLGLQTLYAEVLESTPELEAPDGAIGLAAAALVIAWNEPELLGNAVAYAPEPWPRTAEPLPGYLKSKAAAVLDRMKDTAG